MPLPTPKPPGPDGNPPPYDAMKDLAERCAKAEAELERAKSERDEALVARDFADAALERVQKRGAAMRRSLLTLREASAVDRTNGDSMDARWVWKVASESLQPDAGSEIPDWIPIRPVDHLKQPGCSICEGGNPWHDGPHNYGISLQP